MSVDQGLKFHFVVSHVVEQKLEIAVTVFR